MKSKILIAILVLVVLGQFIVIRSDKQIIRKMTHDHANHETQAVMDGYERCISSLDEAHFANHSDNAGWLKARQGCRDFWFQGGGTETTKP
jgi:hypothetical protein